ncbi:MAG TPA: rhodanese-like domain-containing protein [Gemmatimonadales bacterium]|jgi:rhodanese-related sulfurtransferase
MTRGTVVLGTAAAALGALAGVLALTGTEAAALDRPLAALVEANRLSALDVAAWLRDRKPNLTILDVRPDSAAFAEFHLPRARHASLAELRALTRDPGMTIVVYGDGGDLAARAWVVLRVLGHDTVRVMPDGVGDWLAAVLNPTLPSDATAEARDAFATQAELSRYFGGLPRIVPPGEHADSTATAATLLQRTSRRGCAF